MLLNDVDYETIKHHYQIEEHEGIQLLAHLDRIKFIDLLPGNRVKLLTSRNFRWRKNGPIEKMAPSQMVPFFLSAVECERIIEKGVPGFH